jgi:hypothetical protein
MSSRWIPFYFIFYSFSHFVVPFPFPDDVRVRCRKLKFIVPAAAV